KAFGIAQPPAIFDAHVAAVGPAQLLQPLHEGRSAGLPFRVVRGQAARQHADPPHTLALLRTRRKWPRDSGTAEKANELAPPHSITSSARASSVSGTVRPSALAVLRLITSSNLVGCWMGKSAGLAPLRMRSTYAAARRNRSVESLPYDSKPPAVAK